MQLGSELGVPRLWAVPELGELAWSVLWAALGQESPKAMVETTGQGQLVQVPPSMATWAVDSLGGPPLWGFHRQGDRHLPKKQVT